MRTRDTSYKDYQLNNDDVNNILLFCRQNTTESNNILFKCAFESNASIGADLFYSLSQDVSYERLDAIKSVSYPKNDFYGYRRKCIALIYQAVCTKK